MQCINCAKHLLINRELDQTGKSQKLRPFPRIRYFDRLPTRLQVWNLTFAMDWCAATLAGILIFNNEFLLEVLRCQPIKLIQVVSRISWILMEGLPTRLHVWNLMFAMDWRAASLADVSLAGVFISEGGPGNEIMKFYW